MDGGFESATSGWLAASSTGRELIVHTSNPDLFITPAAGEYVAWLGFGENDTSTLEQEFTLPVTAELVTVSGFIWIATEENDVDGPFDFARIELAQGQTVRVQTAGWSNEDNTPGWEAFEIELYVAPYAGMRMTFRLWSDSDSNLDTSFWFDTVALRACGQSQ
jgi:hypothetical protein